MKIENAVIVPLLTLTTFFSFSLSQSSKEQTEELSLECTLSNVLFLYFNRQYTCTVKSNLKVLNQDTTIVAVDGECGTGQVISNVTFFYAIFRTIRYIPKGLDVLLPGLTGLRFESTQLKHVTKENFRAFPNLLSFASVFNDIQYIERDLFMYNTRLEFVSFRSNKITYIDPFVFDAVSTSLVHLWLDGTVTSCGLSGVTSNANVLKSITKLKNSECANEENAPALYLYWLQQQQNSNDCEATLADKDVEIANINAQLSAVMSDYDAVNTELTAANAQILKKDEECRDETEAIQSENLKIIMCILDPTLPDCPSLDVIRKTYSARARGKVL